MVHSTSRPVRLFGWFTFALLLLAWAYWPTLMRTVQAWHADPDYSHGYLVIPLAYAIWVRRRDDESPTGISPSVWGLALVAAAAIFRLAAARYYLLQVDGWSIPLWLGGVIWTFAGWSAFQRAAPSLAFLWFACPLPERFQLILSLPLQERAAAGSAWLLQCFQQPAVAAGTTLLLGDEIFDVEFACSGLRMFFGSLALATAFVFLGPRDRLTRVAILLAVAPVALMANIVRIVVTATLYRVASTEISRRFAHDFAGLLMVGVVLVQFALLIGVIQWARRWSQRNRDQFVRWLPVWPVLAASLAALLWFWHARQAERVQHSLLTAAARFETNQDWPAAIEYLRRYVQLNPQDARGLARLALAMNQNAAELVDRRRALTALTAAWKANDDDLSLARQLAQVAIELRQFPQAIEITKEILAHPELGQAEHLETAQLAVRWRAVAMYEMLAESNEFGAFGWPDVAKALEDAAERDPSYPQHAFRLAIVYRERLNVPSQAERQQSADRVVDRMVNANEESAEAWLVRYRYRRRYQRSEQTPPDELASIDADLNRALVLDERSQMRNVHILVAIAERMRERGETDTSLTYYQQALETNSLDVRPYLAIAEIWTERATPVARERAVDVLRQGLAIIGPDEVPLMFPLIEQLSLLQRGDEADRVEGQVAASCREYPEPIRTTYLVQLEQVRAWRLANRSEYGPAAELLATKLNELPAKYASGSASYVAQAWATVGQYYRMANDWDRAADAYQRAAALDEAWRLEYRWSIARRAETRGDLSAASQELNELAAANQDSFAAWMDAAALAFRQQLMLPTPLRDWTQFRRALDSAKAVSEERIDEAIVLEANYLLTLGQEERVQKQLEESLAERPESVPLRRSLALYLVRRGRLDDAVRLLDQLPTAVNSTDSVLLKKEILCAAERFDEAIQLLESAIAAEGPKDLTTLRLELAWILLQQGQWDVARTWLEQAAAGAPNDVRVTEARGQLAWCIQDWDLLEECESRLRLIEGNYGPTWRAFRIRRMLGQSGRTDQANQNTSEIDALTQQLESLYPHMQQTRIAAGRVATYRGLLWKAVANYEEAWELGMPRVSLAVDLVSLLNELGETDRAQRYVTEIRQYLAATQHVLNSEFLDLASESADEAIRMSDALVRQQPDSDAYIRLGRTLVLTALPGQPDYEQRLQRAEQAFRDAVQLNPANTQAWAALFRYLVAVRPDPFESQAVLEKLAEREDVSPLNRAFVLAQLNESIRNDADADRFYRQALDLAKSQVAPGERLIVLERSAQYFRRNDVDLAETCCREALQIDSQSLGPLQILLEILLERQTPAAAADALQLLASFDLSWQASDQGKRLQARTLLAASLGSVSDAADLRRRALELLSHLNNKQSMDSLLLAELHLMFQDRPAAVAELRLVAESLPSDHAALLRFLKVYDEALYGDTRSRLYVERIYDQLEELPDRGVAALQQRVDLALARAENTPEQRQPVAASMIQRFARHTLDGANDEAEQFQLLTRLMHELLAGDRWEQAALLTDVQPELLPAPRTASALATALAMTDPQSEQVRTLKPRLQKWLRDYPTDAELQFSIANVHLMAGENEEAIALLRSARDRSPRHVLTLNNLALGLAHQDTSQIPESLQLIEEALGLAGRAPDLLDTLGVLRILQQQYDEAIAVLLEALPHSPSQDVVYLHLAWAWNHQGDAKMARFAWNMARSLGLEERIVGPADRLLREKLRVDLAPGENAPSSIADPPPTPLGQIQSPHDSTVSNVPPTSVTSVHAMPMPGSSRQGRRNTLLK